MGEKFFQPPMIRYSTSPGHALRDTSRWPRSLYEDLILPLSTPHSIRSWAAVSCTCVGVLLVKSPIRQIPETNTHFYNLYYYRRAVLKKLSPKFLAGRSNSTAITASIFMRLHLANPRPLCDRFCLLSFVFYEKNNNAVFRHRRYVYAARLMGLRNR